MLHKKAAEQARESQPASSLLPWPLLQFLPPASYPTPFTMGCTLETETNPFPPCVALCQCFLTATENPTLPEDTVMSRRGLLSAAPSEQGWYT